MLDFMQPQVAGGQLVGLCGEARRDESGRKGNATVIAFLMHPNNPNSNIEMNAAQTAANSLGKRIVVFTSTLQHCADELVGHLCEAWPEREYAAKSVDVALFVLERAISEMRGQP